MIRLTLRRWVAILTISAIITANCGGDQQTTCGDIQNAFESANIHILPGTEVRYELSPPTSGPHIVPAPNIGVYRSPISEPLQVGALESGTVILQYSRSLDSSYVEKLEALADHWPIIVAPAARSLDEDSAIALTAWGTRLLCSGFDLDTTQNFIRTHTHSAVGNH